MNKKILIVDDHSVVRVGTSIILENEFKDITLAFASDYDEIKEKLSTEKFDLILLDLDIPGSLFKEMIKELKAIQNDILIMIFSSYKEDIAIQYIKEGADGFFNKLNSEAALVKAVASMFESGYYYPAELIHQFVKEPKKAANEILSEREFQIFKLLAIGNGNLEIANILNIQVSTVGTYKKRIFDKLKIKNIIDLAKIYSNLH
ncbi:DNA-binding response regulator [Chryseobacterium nematophagum]|uniref:DNA-binding response regulator n=1 Tax=Chryseobacterium nematophagum TaxID=2305228 RepID=A0A3M7THQ3_9FLAO|nr:response regulator transcription factor [Chryseobacterium nematophagum]RNA61730.1 DNA-binding response regulator [Chryseobacterium nematophagum]